MIKHFLNISDLSSEGLTQIINLSFKMKKDKDQFRQSLKNKSIGLYFQKPSMRTRVSFEVGISELGAYAVNLHADEIKIGFREPIKDVSRVLSRYLDAIMLRVNRHSDLEELASYSDIPVINGLSDLSHPCQALADMLTVFEQKGRFDIKLAYLGDGNNVCNSLIEISSLLGVEMIVSCPDNYEPAIPLFDNKKRLYTLEPSPEKAVEGADVVYTDVWTSMGQEEAAARRKKIFASYKVTSNLFKRAKKDAVFLHCLPAHRGEEVDDDVIESKQSLVFDQAENRLHVQKALILHLINN